jgi:hypothetical protein
MFPRQLSDKLIETQIKAGIQQSKLNLMSKQTSRLPLINIAIIKINNYVQDIITVTFPEYFLECNTLMH